MASDLIPLGRPRNTNKKDFALYNAVGGMGTIGGIQYAPSNGRFSFWIDHNPFATAIHKLVAQNVSFSIYSAWASGAPVPGTEIPMYLRIEQSNDTPLEVVTRPEEFTAGRTLYFDPSLPGGLPPYYLNTRFLTNPTDPDYVNDQGRYVFDAYDGRGFGLALTSGHEAIFQSFVPQSPILTGIWLKRLFRVGSTSDHTLYSDITVGLYDANLDLIGIIGKLKKEFPIEYGNNPSVLEPKYNTAWYTTADDSNEYWVDIDQIQLIPDKPLPLKPGDTYYIGIMPDSYGSSINYAVGGNSDVNGNYNGRGRYIFGQAYVANKTGPDFTSVTPLNTDLSVCFTTQRNTGRTAYTFMWDNSVDRYWNPPTAAAVFSDQFKFIKENFDQRI